ISGDSDLFRQVQTATARFDESVRQLHTRALRSGGDRFVSAVHDASVRFLQDQQELLDARRQVGETSALVRRFETELLPLSNELDVAVTQLAAYKERVLVELYARAKH